MDHGNVGVIILSHNDWEQTLACLAQVHGQSSLPRRIVVVNNGSDEENAALLFQAWSDLCVTRDLPVPAQVYGDGLGLAPLTLLHRIENEGVAGGMNAGLRYLLYDQDCLAFWLLHSDTLPEPYALAALLHEATKQPKAGIIGSTLLFMDSDLVQCSAGGTVSRLTALTSSLDNGRERFVLSDSKEILEQIQFVDGASCLITRSLTEAIGLYNEKLHFFYEDVDYSLRAVQAGFSLAWAPGCLVRHKAAYVPGLTPVISRTYDPHLDRLRAYYFVRNRFYILKRENPWAMGFSYLNLLFSRRARGGLPVLRAYAAALDGARNQMDKIPAQALA